MISILIGFIGLWLIISYQVWKDNPQYDKLDALEVGLTIVGIGASCVVSLGLVVYGIISLL